MLFNFLLDILRLHLKTLKICLFPVVQLYVEMIELVNRLEIPSILEALSQIQALSLNKTVDDFG